MPDDAGDDPPPPLILDLEVRGRSQVEFISHARERMAERRIDVDQVIDVLIAPEEEWLLAKPPHLRVSKRRADGKIVNVVFDELPDRVCVVTVY